MRRHTLICFATFFYKLNLAISLTSLLVACVITGCSNTKEKKYDYEFVYNEDNIAVECKEFYKSGKLKKHDFGNKFGKIKSLLYGEDGSMIEKFTFEYDSLDRLCRHDFYNLDLDHYTTYHYQKFDSSGNTIIIDSIFNKHRSYVNRNITIKNSEGHIIENIRNSIGGPYRTLYEYDSAGNIVKQMEYLKPGVNWEIKDSLLHIYDSFGNAVKDICYKDDTLFYTITYAFSYDNKGQILSMDERSSWGMDVQAKYKYDNTGNLIEEKYFQNGILCKRVIAEFDQRNNLALHATFDGKEWNSQNYRNVYQQ